MSSFRVRPAGPADVPALMRLKRALAEGEDALHAVRASPADWLRDGFGIHASYTAFVAETTSAERVIGMTTCSRRMVTGWNGPVLFLQDLFVDPEFRRRGVATALAARVAAFANEIGSPILELTVRADNPARDFYRRNGFAHLDMCLTYVLAGPALSTLANQGKDDETLKLTG